MRPFPFVNQAPDADKGDPEAAHGNLVWIQRILVQVIPFAVDFAEYLSKVFAKSQDKTDPRDAGRVIIEIDDLGRNLAVHGRMPYPLLIGESKLFRVLTCMTAEPDPVDRQRDKS